MIKYCNFLFASVFLVVVYAYAQTPSLCTVTEIVDGDTIHCKEDGEILNVRLIGIDAPESKLNPKTKNDAERSSQDVETIMKMGRKATSFVKSHLSTGETVKLEFDIQKQDRYGRTLAYLYLPDGSMLNELIVREGYAQVMTIPPNVKFQELFLTAQKDARENKRGLWE